MLQEHITVADLHLLCSRP